MSEQTPTSVAALQADIAARRERLARTLGELAGQATPQNLAKRETERYKARFAAATTTPDGGLRTERVAAMIGAGLAVLTLLFLTRKSKRR